MTRAERTDTLRERLEQARADALESSAAFDHLVEAYSATPAVLEKAAEAVIVAAVEVRAAARAVLLDSPRLKRAG